jgi:hypothetical protein
VGTVLGAARLVGLYGHDLVEDSRHGGVHHVAQARGAVQEAHEDIPQLGVAVWGILLPLTIVVVLPVNFGEPTF